ncbi:hypothetical protein F5Y13DRAFT_70347 [Hypoxylon sp. FL1857]|nr:hypothetical protein F5Y13DRAFT_70347 [Hypoxylon sp. FL1857]
MPARRRPRGADKDTFIREFPAAVVYDLSVPDEATIRVPPRSTWTSGPHWHESHTEFLQVLAGRARITLSGRTFDVGPEDGVVTVPRRAVHEWRRAGSPGESTGEREEELVVKEWTEPKDGAKEVFFRNLNGLILDAAADGEKSSGALLELELWNLFWRADNYPVILNSSWIGGIATKIVMGAAVVLGWVLGCKGVYEEYSSR